MDEIRTSTYKNAIINNSIDFNGKVVMDVGAGSGILSIFAAMAGASKVYAVEASNMAECAKILVEKNGFGSIIEVIEAKVEDID
jgi:histone-arginine methyltransferase CARM1